MSPRRAVFIRHATARKAKRIGWYFLSGGCTLIGVEMINGKLYLYPPTNYNKTIISEAGRLIEGRIN